MYYNDIFNILYGMHNRGLRRFREATNVDLHILNNAHYNVENIGFGHANFIRNHF